MNQAYYLKLAQAYEAEALARRLQCEAYRMIGHGHQDVSRRDAAYAAELADELRQYAIRIAHDHSH